MAEEESLGVGADDRLVYPSVVDRYYKRKYIFDSEANIEEDLCVLIHSNRICIITVAKSHPIIKEKRKVVSVSFNVGDGISRLDNKVSGKGKKGGQVLSPSSRLCVVKCEDGEEFTIHSGIKAQLIEVNENLIENPQLLSQKPQSDGFIAIVLPKKQEHEQIVKKLKTEDEYNKRRFKDENT